MGFDFLAAAKAHQAKTLDRRRDFHRHPELAFKETRTAGIVADVLRALGLKVRTGVGKTGVVGLLEGAQDGPTVMIRADMDALPVQEQNEAEYASTIAGKMHACGHDGHTAVALTVAEILSEHRAQIAGRVKFIFQPAEEIGNGSQAMIEDGALEDPVPDVALGLHFWSGMETGKIAVGAGPIMAGADIFKVNVTGSGGHGAAPEQTHDPVIAAAQIIVALQTVVSRNVSPTDSAVLSVCRMQAGDAFNIIPGTAKLSGTFRSYEREVRDTIIRRTEEIAGGIAQAMGCTATVEVGESTSPVNNDAEVSDAVRRAISTGLGADYLADAVRKMGAEDMCFFLDRVPGCFFFVGSGSAAKGTDYPHHHPRFDLDEDALAVAVAAMLASVAQYVMP